MPAADSADLATATAAVLETNAPMTDYLAAQFKTQVDLLATDAATYRADVSKHDNTSVIQDAGTLYSEVAGFPGVLHIILGHVGQSDLPAVAASAKMYADALNAVNGGTGGSLASLEKAVHPAAAAFRCKHSGGRVGVTGNG